MSFKNFMNKNIIIWVEVADIPQLKSHIQHLVKFDEKNLKPDQSCHHMTLFFKPSEAEIEYITTIAKEGDEVTMYIDKICNNNMIQALHVSKAIVNGEKIEIPGKILHITVSAAPKVAPVKSNEMLVNPSYCENIDIVVKGILKTKPLTN